MIGRAGRQQTGVSMKRRPPPPVDPRLLAERRAGRMARLRRGSRVSGALLMVAVVVGGTGYGVHILTQPETFPLQAVRFDSELERVREQDLRTALDPHLHGGFWKLDVERIRQAVQELAWVDTASVRREWPGLLRVNIEEQQAVASWNDTSLLNARGDGFTPPRDTWPRGLPALSGPERKSASVTRRLQELKPAFADLGLEVQGLRMDARESWTVTLEDGTSINLGREDVDDRIARFTETYRKLDADKQRRLASVDLRYPNGFAIRWADAPGDKQ